jgi:hypothetical protein
MMVFVLLLVERNGESARVPAFISGTLVKGGEP